MFFQDHYRISTRLSYTDIVCSPRYSITSGMVSTVTMSQIPSNWLLIRGQGNTCIKGREIDFHYTLWCTFFEGKDLHQTSAKEGRTVSLLDLHIPPRAMQSQSEDKGGREKVSKGWSFNYRNRGVS